MNKISFIIINYKSDEDTQECVNSIFTYSNFINKEIIIVNNSPSKLNFLLREYPKKIVNIIQMNKNVGFATGCNIAIKQSSGNWLLLINPDARLIDCSLKTLFNTAINYQEKAAWGGIIQKNGKIIQSFDQFFTPRKRMIYHVKKTINKIFNRKKGGFGYKIFKKPFEVDYITGAVLMIPKQVWELAEGMDDRFFLFYEEQDLQFRLSHHKIKRIIHPNAHFSHKHSASIKSGYLKELLMLESELKFCNKHFGKLFYIYTSGLFIVRIVNTMLDTVYKEYSLNENIKILQSIIKQIKRQGSPK